ncbi:MAG: hypothetical protein UR93_C0023G0002 [Berkelbacteria bacterium GW2011_GWA2_35_9]|uniref:Uncharacterized protein n=1 Tax=Berkelbacteria bacterium GW2011_GWA2_35_9 TaxID=1618333 RepID=A0A0G0D3V9_9BACT|nr:MAG: hypothetical protein UR93_C0023G0002 [Berkelbacteria bacterium GW2011_GWA2_35_9]
MKQTLVVSAEDLRELLSQLFNLRKEVDFENEVVKIIYAILFNDVKDFVIKSTDFNSEMYDVMSETHISLLVESITTKYGIRDRVREFMNEKQRHFWDWEILFDFTQKRTSRGNYEFPEGTEYKSKFDMASAVQILNSSQDCIRWYSDEKTAMEVFKKNMGLE